MSIHVTPKNDERPHVLGATCWCKPEVAWAHPETGQPYPRGPLLIHNSADSRETSESITGESVSPSLNWELLEVESE